MTQPTTRSTILLSRRLLLGLVLAGLGLLCLLTLWSLLSPIAWAAIIAYVTWPAYQRLPTVLRRREALAAGLMSVLVTCAIVLPLFFLILLLKDEFLSAYALAIQVVAEMPRVLPGAIRAIPWLGDSLQQGIDRYLADPQAVTREALAWIGRWQSEFAYILGSVGRNLIKLVLAMLTLFFFYRDGGAIVRQARLVARRFFATRLDPYIDAAGTMVRAVLSGLMVTALAQGLLAGIGYWLVGVHAPVLLGTLTAVLSLIPLLGTAIVWGPIGIWLLATSSVWQGLVLLAWGTLIVHPTDNLLRPLLISSATHVPFLVVVFGVIGGLAAFGFVGVVLGPVVLALAVAVWREWTIDEGLAEPSW